MFIYLKTYKHIYRNVSKHNVPFISDKALILAMSDHMPKVFRWDISGRVETMLLDYAITTYVLHHHMRKTRERSDKLVVPDSCYPEIQEYADRRERIMNILKQLYVRRQNV